MWRRYFFGPAHALDARHLGIDHNLAIAKWKKMLPLFCSCWVFYPIIYSTSHLNHTSGSSSGKTAMDEKELCSPTVGVIL
jgi:hypothetical protein